MRSSTTRSLSKSFLVALTALAALGFAATARSASAADTPPGTQVRASTALENWSRLRYTTSKLLIFSGELTMTRSVTSDKVSVRTESQARLFGSAFVESWSLSTMDRKTGRPLEFLDVRPAKKADRWRFLDDGVEHSVLKPHQGRATDPVERWKVTKTETLKNVDSGASPSRASLTTGSSAARPGSGPTGDTAPSAGGVTSSGPGGTASSQWVHDYISMIVRLADLPLTKVGDQATVRVSTSRGPAPMRIRVGATRTTRRKITDLATGRSRSIEMKELRLRVTPLAGSRSDTRGFLNMEGETELWVDAATRTLIEISGNVPKVPGRVVITLAGST